MQRVALLWIFSGLILLSGCDVLYDSLAMTLDSCATDKIAFSMDTSCQNDGSYEFCIPNDAPDYVTTVTSIAPATTCGPGRGRASCDPDSQHLCMVDLQDACGPNHQPTEDFAAWRQACALADLPFIEMIVPTWYE